MKPKPSKKPVLKKAKLKKTAPKRATVKSIKKKATKTKSAKILGLIAQALDSKKAEDLLVLDVSKQSSITDFMVLATGTSEPHLRALRVELEKVLDGEKVPLLGMDQSEGSGWTVIDAFDIMIHIFTPENRGKYRLERLWNDAETIPLNTLL